MKVNATFQDYFVTFALPSLGAFSLIIYVIVLIPIVRYRKKYSNPFYLFLIAIAIFDCFNLLYSVFQGFCLYLSKCPGGNIINILFTDTQWYFYSATALVYLCTAWNRFSCVALYQYHIELFSSRMMLIYMIAAMLISALENIPIFTYHVNFYVDLGYAWFVQDPPYLSAWIYINMGKHYFASHRTMSILK